MDDCKCIDRRSFLKLGGMTIVVSFVKSGSVVSAEALGPDESPPPRATPATTTVPRSAAAPTAGSHLAAGEEGIWESFIVRVPLRRRRARSERYQRRAARGGAVGWVFVTISTLDRSAPASGSGYLQRPSRRNAAAYESAVEIERFDLLEVAAQLAHLLQDREDHAR